MKLITKALLSFGICSVVTTSVVTPLVVLKTNKRTSPKLIFNNLKFNSKADLLEYVDKNHEALKSNQDNNIYSVNIGNDVITFNEYYKAINYINSKLISKEVYLDPKIKEGSLLGEISPTSYFDKESSGLYVVFEKYNPSSTIGNPKRSYVFAKKPVRGRPDYSRLQEEYLKARNEAASSFIQVHNAFYYDGIYFSTTNGLREYLNSHRDDQHQFNSYLDNTSQMLLATKDGGNLIYRVPNNVASSPKDYLMNNKDYLMNNSEFQNNVMQLANPTLKRTIDGNNISYDILQGNKANLSTLIDEKKLNIINVKNNGDEVTQIVDMQITKKMNGNIYGKYFVRSGTGMKNITNSREWNPTSQSPEGIGTLSDVKTLKAAVTYLFNNKGFRSPFDILGEIKLKRGESKSFIEFIMETDEHNKDKLKVSFLDQIVILINDLSKGVRYNHLDTITTLYSYLINSMIQNKIDSATIIKTAKYFDSMASVLDNMIAEFIAPMLLIDDNNEGWKEDEYKINYFKKVFNFYNENQQGHGIDFQKNRSSYYRRLIEGDSELTKSTEGLNNASIFAMIKASMAVQIIAMKTFRSNELNYGNYVNGLKKALKLNEILAIKTPLIYSNIKYSNNLNNNSIHKLKFEQYTTEKKDQKESIWNVLKGIKTDVVFKNENSTIKHQFSSQRIIDNYNTYLTKEQNKILDKYIDSIEENVAELRKKYVTGYRKENKTFLPLSYSQIIDKDFDYSTFEFLSNFSADNIFIDAQTESERRDSANKMRDSLVKPRIERIVDFATPIATVVVEIGIAVASAGMASEGLLLEQSFSKFVRSGMKWKEGLEFKKRLSRASDLTKAQLTNKKFDIKNLNKNRRKWIKSVANAIDNASGSKTDGWERSVGNFVGSFYGNAMQALGFSSGASKVIGEIYNIATRVTMNVAKNIIPGLKGLLNIINSFSSSVSNVYVYDKTEDGSKFYWDGDLIEYSWWGLSANHKYTIDDLKMIPVHTIISGYTSSQSKYYYNGEFKSLDDIKLSAAANLVHKYTSVPRSQFLSGELQSNRDDVVWTLKLKNRQDIETATLKELIEEVADIAANTSFPSKVYGVKGKGLKSTWNNWVDNLIDDQKKVLVLGLPQIDNNGNITRDSKFELPKPYYSDGRIIKLDDEKQNSKFVVFNPNFNQNALKKITGNDLKIKATEGLTAKETKDNLIQAIKDTSQELSVANTKTLSKFVAIYAANINVAEKEVIFEEINQNQSGFVNDDNNYARGTFESISTKLTKNIKTLYGFIDAEGQEKFFLKSRDAISRIMNKSNYNLNSITINRGQIYYVFAGITFISKNRMYDYVLKQAKAVK